MIQAVALIRFWLLSGAVRGSGLVSAHLLLLILLPRLTHVPFRHLETLLPSVLVRFLSLMLLGGQELLLVHNTLVQLRYPLLRLAVPFLLQGDSLNITAQRPPGVRVGKWKYTLYPSPCSSEEQGEEPLPVVE